MAITMEWDDDQQRIIRADVNGQWSFDEMEAALRQTIAMMESVSHKVDFIIDVSRSSLIPGGATRAAQSVATPETHPNEGIKIVVGANVLVRLAYEAYRRINRSLGKDQEFLFAGNLDEARALIARFRSSAS
jgi:hypothetical protein